MDGHRKCFVIMPFGEKRVDGDSVVDFDTVYRDVFVGAVTSMGFEPVRCDMITQAGSIHLDMLTHIAVDDLALVDITTSNPNVFYELGVRHALRRSMTILTKRRGVDVPFNIRDQRIIEYPGVRGTFAESQEEIRMFISSGLKSNRADSPIFNILQSVGKDWKRERITTRRKHSYQLAHQPDHKINVITGDIRQWRDIDVWVNSENTNLQMARFYDRSLSAMIRYEGAGKDDNDQIVEDTIANELADLLGSRASVAAGTVHVTGSGALADTLGVKKIFHAATTHGTPASGYQVVQEVERCVTASLQRMDHARHRGDHLRTVVFPMMGTGEGGGDVGVVAPRLIGAAASYLVSNPNTTVAEVNFSAWNQRDLEACLAALDTLAEVEPTGGP